MKGSKALAAIDGLRLEISGATDTGQVRTHNEDAIGFDTSQGILVLADGVGGQAGGEVASRLAVDGCLSQLRDLSNGHDRVVTPDDERPCPFPSPQPSPRGRGGERALRVVHTKRLSEPDAIASDLRDQVIILNARIYAESLMRSECHGMSTTLVLGYVHGDRFYYCHLGDSRLYLLRAGELTQLTQDHTLVQELEDAYGTGAGALAPSNIITRAMGAAMDCNPDCASCDLQPGDLFLLCSDGLTTYLTHADLEQYLSESATLPELTKGLIDEANWRGGRDNISVILLRIHRA